MSLGKKGQLGKTLAFPFVLVFLAVIVVLFFVVSAALGALRGEAKDEEEKLVRHAPAWLLEEVCVSEREVEGCGREERMLLADALLLFDDNKMPETAVEQALKRMLVARGEGMCVAIALGEKERPAGNPGGATHDDFVFEYKNGKVKGINRGAYPQYFAKYRNAGMLEQWKLKHARTQKVLFVEGVVRRCVS